MFARFRPAVILVALAGLLGLPACKKDETPTHGMGLSNQDSTLVMKSRNNLKQIGLAIHNYEAVHGHFPNNIAGPDGKTPGLSWRVAILPYIEEPSFYNQFHLNEAWDSDHNRELLARIPPQYLPPGVKDNYNGYTYYRAFNGKGAFLPAPDQVTEPGFPFRGLTVTSILDGTANTLAVAEAAEPVPWTKPEELEFNLDGPPPKLGGIFREGANVLLIDGSGMFLETNTPPTTLKAFITINGGENVRLP